MFYRAVDVSHIRRLSVSAVAVAAYGLHLLEIRLLADPAALIAAIGARGTPDTQATHGKCSSFSALRGSWLRSRSRETRFRLLLDCFYLNFLNSIAGLRDRLGRSLVTVNVPNAVIEMHIPLFRVVSYS